MSKNTYKKEDVWGIVWLVVFIFILGLFIARERHQSKRIDVLEEAIVYDRKQFEGLQDSHNRIASDYIDKDKMESIKEELESDFKWAKDRAETANDGLWAIEEKLADRIPNWSKK